MTVDHENAHQCRCLVRGSINNDEYFYVKNIARPGQTISSKQYESRIGGKGANQAVAIARAGGIADFHGTIGHDGLWVKEKMGDFGVDTAGILVSEDPTGRALIQVADDGENSIILFPGANHSQLHEQKFAAAAGKSILPNPSHLLLQNEIHFQSTLHALSTYKDATIIFNPSPLPTSEEITLLPWHDIDWLIVNEGEAEELYHILSGNSDALSNPHDVLLRLAKEPAVAKTNIICTLGPDGVLAFMHHYHDAALKGADSSRIPAPYLQVPAAKVRARDTTGAGDCFTGYFVKGLMESGATAKVGMGIEEADIERILRVCVQAAGMCVEKEGTIDSMPTRDEVEAKMHNIN